MVEGDEGYSRRTAAELIPTSFECVVFRSGLQRPNELSPADSTVEELDVYSSKLLCAPRHLRQPKAVERNVIQRLKPFAVCIGAWRLATGCDAYGND